MTSMILKTQRIDFEELGHKTMVETGDEMIAKDICYGKPDFTKLKEIHLEELARRFRMQRIVFTADVSRHPKDLIEILTKQNA